MAQLLVATVNGQLVHLDTENPSPKPLFSAGEKNALMGLCRDGDYLYVASMDRLFKLKASDFSLVKKTRQYFRFPGFHQMNCYDGKIYLSATRRNQFWIYDEHLHRERRISIAPPDITKPMRYKKNYNHINTIVKYDNKFYVNLNWLNEQYGDSGVLVLNEDFIEEDKFAFGWESHDFMIVDGKKMVICSTSSKEKPVQHERRSGLMVEGKLVWEHDPEETFCKGLCLDEKFIYMGGGKIAKRKNREHTSGVIYIIDRSNYQLVKKIEHPDLRGIRGVMRID